MQAMILAGGKGERLRPVTELIPKSMISVDGHPIIWHQIQQLRAAQVTDITILTGYLSDQIVKYCNHVAIDGINIRYSHEQQPLGRGGALKLGLNNLEIKDKQPIIVMNGDIISKFNIAELLRDYHARARHNTAHMASILTVALVSSYGIVGVDQNGLVDTFNEKIVLPYQINAGIYVMNPYIKEFLPDIGDHETETLPFLAHKKQLSAITTQSFWVSIDSFKDLELARNTLRDS